MITTTDLADLLAQIDADQEVPRPYGIQLTGQTWIIDTPEDGWQTCHECIIAALYETHLTHWLINEGCVPAFDKTKTPDGSTIEIVCVGGWAYS